MKHQLSTIRDKAHWCCKKIQMLLKYYFQHNAGGLGLKLNSFAKYRIHTKNINNMFTSPLDQCSKEPKMMSHNCKTRPESVIFSTYLINQQHVQIVSWQPWAWIAFIYTSQSSNGQPFSQLSLWKLCSKANKRRYKWIYATVILLKVAKDSVTDNAGSRTPVLALTLSFLFCCTLTTLISVGCIYRQQWTSKNHQSK